MPSPTSAAAPSHPTPTARPRWSFRGFLEAALFVGSLGAFGLCLLTLAAFAGDRHWLLELITHFRPHYAAGLFICTAVYAFACRFRLTALFVACALLNVLVLAPRFTPRATPPADAPTIKLLLANVLTDNRDHASLLALIAREQPDVIALLEVNDGWLHALAPLSITHPHSHRVPRADNFGIVLFSRLPLSDLKTVYLSPSEVPSIRATLTLGTCPISLLATHPLPPGTADNLTLRDLQLAAIARWSTEAPHPAIVLGDLNCTPWSPAFRTLLREGALHDTGRGLNPTWPDQPWLLRIPLDHCLTSSAFAVADHRVGPHIGSDHFPLIVTLALSPPAR